MLVDITNFEDFDFGNMLLEDKSYENVLIYNVLNETLIGAKTLCIMFNKVDWFIRDYDGTKYLVLFALEKYNAIDDRIKYLIQLKKGITYVFSQNFAKSKVYSDDDLSWEETLNSHNVLIFNKSVFNKNQNHNYCNIFSKKCPYQLVKN